MDGPSCNENPREREKENDFDGTISGLNRIRKLLKGQIADNVALRHHCKTMIGPSGSVQSDRVQVFMGKKNSKLG